MRVVLLGSSRPAVVALETLRRLGVDVVGVGAHAGERENDMGSSLLETASRYGIPTAEFSADRRHEIGEFARSLQPDVGLTVGFRYLIDADTLRIPTHGWLNVHSSLLPAYRGRAPVNWAIIEGERELGATLHVIDAGVDAGDIVFQERFALRDDEDVSDALRYLESAYESLVSRAVEAVFRGRLPRTPMPPGDGRLWPRRTPEDGLIDWSRPAEEVLRLIRAITSPYPGAFTPLAGRRLYVLKARFIESLPNAEPGLVAGPRTIHAADGSIEPLSVVFRDGEDEETIADLAPFVGAVCGR